MRVFVTGATGFIGQAVVKQLLETGHQVLGLTRSDKGAELLSSLGAQSHYGSIDDLDSLKRGTAESDGVIHLAFDHDFSRFEATCRQDRLAIETMGGALVGTNKPLIIASGTLILPQGRLATENDLPTLRGTAASRGISELVTLSYAAQGVRAMVVRLSPTNHGEGDQGFISRLVATARQKGVSVYVGGGENCWPAVHRLDTARLFQLALDNGKAGSVYHAVGEEGVPIKHVAEAIGKQLNVLTVSVTIQEAGESLGFVGMASSLDNPTSSAQTREELGWVPTHPSLLEDINSGTYNESYCKFSN
jgi:nucleoside-diphosphate-sugar epimerase